MYTHSPELALMHATIRFYTNVSKYHNSILLDQRSLYKYNTITHDSPIEYGNNMIMIMKSIRKIFSYTIVSDINNNHYTTADQSRPYYTDLQNRMNGLFGGNNIMAMSGSGIGNADAVFLLDKYSSIWDAYNTVIFNRNSLILRYHDPVKDGDIDDDGDNDGIFDGVEDFSQLIHLNCMENVLLTPCVVTLTPNVTSINVNSIDYSHIKLVVDFNSAFNYLPVDIYEKWINHDNHNLKIQLTDTTFLPLSNKFQFIMHEEPVILIGIDLIHYFPKVAYSQGVDNKIRIWYYYSIEESYETHQSISILFTFTNAVSIIGLFIWGTSYNFYVLSYIVNFREYSKRIFYFAQKQVFVELAVIFIALIQCILVLVFSWNSNYLNLLSYSSAYADRRKIIFLLYSVYQSVVALIIICIERTTFKNALETYTPRLYLVLFHRPTAELSTKEMREKLNEAARKREFSTNPVKTAEELDLQTYSSTVFLDVPNRTLRTRLYTHVIKHYHDPIMKLSTDIVIMRNLKLILCILSNLMVAYNFQSDYNNVYLIMVVVITLASFVFTLLYLSIIIIHLQKFTLIQLKQHHLLLICYTICEFIVFIGFTIFSFNPVYLVYSDAVNTGHSSTTIVIYILVLLSLMTIYSIDLPLRMLTIRNERLLEYKKLKKKLAIEAHH
jgi:hypothetical protein